MTDCRRNCWIFAALAGLIVWLMAMGQGGAGMFGGLFLGVVTVVLLGGLLIMFFCQGNNASLDGEDGTHAAHFAAAAPRPAPAAPAAVPRAGADAALAGRSSGGMAAPAGASTDPRQAPTFKPGAALLDAEDKVRQDAAAVPPIRMGAPEGASADPRQAVTFSTDPAAVAAPKRLARDEAAVEAIVDPARATADEPTRVKASDPKAPDAATGAKAGAKADAGNVAAKAGKTADAKGAGAKAADVKPVHERAGSKTAGDTKAGDAKTRAKGDEKAPTARAAEPKTAEHSGAKAFADFDADADDLPPPSRPRAPTLAAGGSDELGRILGVGPRLTEWLHENGITRFDQIAAWTPADVQEWAERLGRYGSRIERDDWVGQARILAAGGETEHSRRVDRGESQ